MSRRTIPSVERSPHEEPAGCESGLDSLRPEERLAAALGARVSEVSLLHSRRNERGTALHCKAEWRGKQVFGKLLIARRFPAWDPVVFPSKEAIDSSRRQRSAADQIQTEWESAQKLRSHVAGVRIPQPLGCSSEAGTIVWETIEGRSVTDLLHARSDAGSARLAAMRALALAGGWLRLVQEREVGGEIEVDLGRLTTDIASLTPDAPDGLSALRRSAIRLVEDAAGKIGSRTVSVPSTWSHGDLSPANILVGAGGSGVWIVDFEHVGCRGSLHDLVLVSGLLRAAALHPLRRWRPFLEAERAFWSGYGTLPPHIATLVDHVSTAWVLYWFLPGLRSRLVHRSWGERLKAHSFLAATRIGLSGWRIDRLPPVGGALVPVRKLQPDHQGSGSRASESLR